MTSPQAPDNDRTTFVALTDGGTALFGTVGSPLVTDRWESALAATGSAFLSGSGLQTLSVAGNFRFALVNPASSTKTAFVFEIDGMATATSFGELYVDPTAGVPTANRPANNMFIGNPTAAEATFYADMSTTTALGGGVDSGVSIPFSGGVLVEFIRDVGVIAIPPGVTLGVNVAVTGSAGASMSLNVFWFEQ